MVVYLTQGKIHPDWTGEPEIGMAEKSVVEAIVKATGSTKSHIEKLLSENGDIGITAEIALNHKKISGFGTKELSVSDVYNELDRIAKESGQGSAGRKVDKLVRLMINA